MDFRYVLLLVLLGYLWGCASEQPTLVLTYSPENAVVSVDGFVPDDLRSPHTFTFFKGGQYQLKITAEGYKPVEMLVMLKEGEKLTQTVALVPNPTPFIGSNEPISSPLPQIAVNPPLETDTSTEPSLFMLDVNSTPQGAEIFIRRPGETAISQVAVTPAKISLPIIGATQVVVQRAGYESVKRLVVAPQAGNTVMLNEVLKPLSQATSPDPLPDPIVIPVPPILQNPSDRVGTLSVTTNPWTTVHVDGVNIGNTPISNYTLAVGTHKILMENRDLRKRRVKIIKVRPNEHVRLAEDL